MKKFYQLIICCCCLWIGSSLFNSQHTQAQTYFADALTVFSDNGCLGCHGSQGGLDLNTYASTIAGGTGCGSTVVPNDAAASSLVDKINGGGVACGGVMPPSGTVSAADVAVIEAWINEGALEFAPAGPVYWADVSTVLSSNNCLGCHGTQGGLDLNTYASTTAGGTGCGSTIVPFDAAASTLVDKIDGGGVACGGVMPPSGTVSAGDVAIIAQWINEGALETAAPATPVYWADVSTVLSSNNCLGCHGTQGGLDLNTYASATAGGTGCGSTIVPFDAAASTLVDKIDGGGVACGGVMPPSGTVSTADVAIIAQWINEGALETAAPTCSITDVSATSATCSGTGATFDVSFTPNGDSGMFNVISSGSIIGSGTSSPITVSISNATGSSIDIDVEDAGNTSCVGGTLVNVILPDCSAPAATCAELSGTDVTIDFTGFDGTGFMLAPGPGQLSSEMWEITGLSDGYVAGGDNTGPDHTGSTDGTGVTDGGVYALDDGSNQALWIQPATDDFTPGCIILKGCNNTGQTISALSVGYDAIILNDSDRSNSFDFGYSQDGTSFTSLPSATLNSPEAMDGTTTAFDQIAIVGGINIPNGTNFYLQWCGNDISGVGIRDEFGLDNIVISTNVPTVAVNVKAQLAGAYDAVSGTMSTTLRTSNLIPLSQPYNQAPWNYPGTESYMNATSLPGNAVDWVLVEARSTTDLAMLDRTAAMLLSDGSIVDATTFSSLNMVLASGSDCYLVIRHRNHLDVMSSQTVTVPNTSAYDFTTGVGQAQGLDQMMDLNNGGGSALFAGDYNADGVITYADFNAYVPELGQSNYNVADGNLEGNVTTDDFTIYSPNAKIIGLDAIRY